MTKVVEFLRVDTILNCAYGPGDVAGFPDEIADRLMNPNRPGGAYAKLHGDGKPKPFGRKIPDINGYVSGWGTDQLPKQG
jgi:hypothetical protein